jgi:hypothetical protein
MHSPRGFDEPIDKVIRNALVKGTMVSSSNRGVCGEDCHLDPVFSLSDIGWKYLRKYVLHVERKLPQYCFSPFHGTYADKTRSISPEAYAMLVLPYIMEALGRQSLLELEETLVRKTDGLLTLADALVSLAFHFHSYYRERIETWFPFDSVERGKLRHLLGLDQESDRLVKTAKAKGILSEDEPGFVRFSGDSYLDSGLLQTIRNLSDTMCFSPLLREGVLTDPDHATVRMDRHVYIEWTYHDLLQIMKAAGIKNFLDRTLVSDGIEHPTLGEIFVGFGHELWNFIVADGFDHSPAEIVKKARMKGLITPFPHNDITDRGKTYVQKLNGQLVQSGLLDFGPPASEQWHEPLLCYIGRKLPTLVKLVKKSVSGHSTADHVAHDTNPSVAEISVTLGFYIVNSAIKRRVFRWEKNQRHAAPAITGAVERRTQRCTV